MEIYKPDFNRKNGFSIIEMLIVVTVFSVLALITTQIMAISLGGVIKSENISQVRENVDSSLATMERLLRNASSLDCVSNNRLEYEDEFGNNTSFECITDSGIGHIASGSAAVRLTNNDVNIKCDEVTVFQCDPDSTPRYVIMTIRAEDSSHGTGEEGSSYESGTRVLLRNQ